MTTKNEQLLGDISSFQQNLDGLFNSVSEKRQLVLQSHTDAEQSISDKQSTLLTGLGFDQTKNIKEYHATRDQLHKAGLAMETIDELKKIKDTYGKNIIGYNQLSALCEKHNLYFGDSRFFTGQIPMKNVREIEEFPFDLFASHYTVLAARHLESIVDGTSSVKAKAMIVAPLNLFNLTDVLISRSRELIDFKGVKSKCIFPCAEDPIVIVPFKAKGTNEVFFLIVTHWDNTTSII
jgi:hypothetical protein